MAPFGFKDFTRSSKWSYAKVDDHGLVIQVKEKVAISELATVGIYYLQGEGFCVFRY